MPSLIASQKSASTAFVEGTKCHNCEEYIAIATHLDSHRMWLSRDAGHDSDPLIPRMDINRLFLAHFAHFFIHSLKT